ncbi:MAG: anhydro-N-acetylmuramic acid kinase, partial [Moraxella sp.]|nr:anhydro-N-acetylmuramic acid kinase [Moraxella sp.]
MDGWIHRHKAEWYDQDGAWASMGTVHGGLLAQLMAHDFIQKSAPKSTGREDFHLPWLDSILTDMQVEAVDVQATLCEFTAVSIAREIVKFADTHDELLVCGGGAYNRHLLGRLAELLPTFAIHSTDTVGISPTWVEAVAFGWLARQTMLMQAGNLPMVTGASTAAVLGVVCFA